MSCFPVRFLILISTIAVTLQAGELPKGTDFTVRLKTKVSSTESRAKDPVEGVITSPVVGVNQVLLSPGTLIRGVVTDVKNATQPNDRSEMKIAFDKLVMSTGKTVPIKARVLDVDNAREAVDGTGKIVGILASETISARINQGIEKVSRRNSGFAELLGLAKGAFLKDTDPSITYDNGAEMTVQLLEAVNWNDKVSPPQLAPVRNADKLYAFVNRQPYRTVAQNPPDPSDMTNVMFIGSEDELRSAFSAAGWSSAEALSKATALETFRSIAEMRGYKEAPMSMLLLDGRPPDMVWQKGLNTFAKRHHLRIWRQPDQWNGQDVWVCSSTQDVGIEFSEQNHTFIHKIDPQIDKERAKIVSDLLFTDRVRSLALVERSEVPKQAMNATGDQLLTDGRMAVLFLQ